MRKRLILTSIISIILILVLMIGSTYSIFVTSNIDEDLNVYKTGNLAVTYTLSENNISFTDKVPVSEDDVMSVRAYRITVTNTGNVPYKFNIILNDTTASDTIDYQYIMTKVGKLESKSLADCSVTDKNIIIKSDVVVPANDSAIIDVRVYLSENIQNSELGKSFYAKLAIDGLAVYNDNDDIDNSVLMAPNLTLSDYVINKYNDGSEITTVNIGGSTDNPEVYLNATQGIMLDNNGEYRYYGADPNNYVSYNNELWRIISVSNVKSSESDTTGETRVKIVKADILTDDNGLDAYSWDSSDSTINSGTGVNDWSQADLMTELNTLYFNSTSGNCYTGSDNATTACDFTNTGLSEEARNLTADALYYLGGSSEYKGLYADDYYNFERGTTVYSCSTDDGACPRSTTWTGRIGIIYPSDYAYATDLGVCQQNGYSYETNCSNNDWLWYTNVTQVTISQILSGGNYAFFIDSDGSIFYEGFPPYVIAARTVSPVLYLKSNVSIVSGEGTSENPYILGI